MNKCQQELLKTLIAKGVIKNMRVAQAMARVDRKYYAPGSFYEDSPQYIGYGVTISAPHMHAYALQYLFDKLTTAKYVLDVGSGTGYLTAAMAVITPSSSKIYGIEHVPELVQKSIENISKGNPELIKDKIEIVVGDGRLGWTKEGGIRFDVIHVGAAADKIPQALLEQLAQNGKMIIPVGGQNQTQKFLEISKVQGKTIMKNICGVRYVPLTDLIKQLK